MWGPTPLARPDALPCCAPGGDSAHRGWRTRRFADAAFSPWPAGSLGPLTPRTPRPVRRPVTRARPANPLVRENLLDAGLTLFHARGFNAVGIKEVTDTAGVPKGSFLLVAVRQPPAIAWMDFRSTGALVGLC
ncbi:helix-turn-helix transcriptional regulator [Streptomyces lunaelactis]|uniref:TetR/AcrR family transcriptional regulator n=1 Tax=Streptomyces lunaelactis TaxID=1535768 RepID=UPI0015857EA9|nr:helix-turn-helix transcriptional regulator [Streptomyces lunaelactis]NUK42086.1 helix-turn-helix transcriptional regulator [Streptomyces lunaelactis]NUK60727.1 helix-turn-helix transcriptional regulator [Streptomyces lunaelactis]NUK92417.1 helix-turn-helix transcriptional regulator [Streptomyces lunaelactis]NUL10566.1 helix-turn-helix transcriptional regulator [Streptomyces lunaelactis]